jgi:hypothetical protein
MLRENFVLRMDFDYLQASQVAVVQEKADVEKVEHEKVQQMQNVQRKKLAEL